MSLKHVMEIYELMDDIHVTGETIKAYLAKINKTAEIEVKTIAGEEGSTDFIRVRIPGKNEHAKALGIIGRLGGIGARPEMIGFVSDGDGALASMAIAAKLLDMTNKGDQLEGDVIITTHICPTAPTQPHDPVPFMSSPVDIATMNRYEVDPAMEAILSIDTTKGNQIINHRGFALTPTVKEGYILKVSDDLLHVYTQSVGKLPVTMPITTQDITPYGNDVYHINSILQPAVATDKPVVGVAITTETAVAGCGTGASHVTDIEEVVRYCIEVAKVYGQGKCDFYNTREFNHLESLYGKLTHLQTIPTKEEAI
ncbi:Protein of unknown function [Amphibacillus marinus]|uniref:DUF1177 domain-containing protein n=1 Tax=Amphibacillus marinus TaxID=872970 RepID=A0A1H8S9P1_9BACI|nr:DUF1177 domain-containing protein [Amphibacillus marinus]SEO74883.1 Protein of unknown function [Amphibacillus marinus]